MLTGQGGAFVDLSPATVGGQHKGTQGARDRSKDTERGEGVGSTREGAKGPYSAKGGKRWGGVKQVKKMGEKGVASKRAYTYTIMAHSHLTTRFMEALARSSPTSFARTVWAS